MEPIGDLPLLRVKIRTDQNEPFPELMIFLIVFHIAYLRKRGSRVLIQLEFKNVDPVAACGNGVNSSADNGLKRTALQDSGIEDCRKSFRNLQRRFLWSNIRSAAEAGALPDGQLHTQKMQSRKPVL